MTTVFQSGFILDLRLYITLVSQEWMAFGL